MELVKKKAILKQHQLRITDCRLEVLDLFVQRKHALSQKDLEDTLPQYDRVTLYRTLLCFMEHGIVHRIPNESGFATYGLCFDTCSPEHHTDDHMHFKCNECGHVECLPDTTIPRIEISGEYKIQHAHLIIDGVCESCQS